MDNGAFTLAPFDSDASAEAEAARNRQSMGGGDERRAPQSAAATGQQGPSSEIGSEGGEGKFSSTSTGAKPGQNGSHLVSEGRKTEAYSTATNSGGTQHQNAGQSSSLSTKTTAIEMKTRKAELSDDQREPLCGCENHCPCVETASPHARRPARQVKIKSWSSAKSMVMAGVAVGLVAVCVVIVLMGHYQVL